MPIEEAIYPLRPPEKGEWFCVYRPAWGIYMPFYARGIRKDTHFETEQYVVFYAPIPIDIEDRLLGIKHADRWGLYSDEKLVCTLPLQDTFATQAPSYAEHKIEAEDYCHPVYHQTERIGCEIPGTDIKYCMRIADFGEAWRVKYWFLEHPRDMVRARHITTISKRDAADWWNVEPHINEKIKTYVSDTGNKERI